MEKTKRLFHKVDGKWIRDSGKGDKKEKKSEKKAARDAKGAMKAWAER